MNNEDCSQILSLYLYVDDTTVSSRHQNIGVNALINCQLTWLRQNLIYKGRNMLLYQNQKNDSNFYHYFFFQIGVLTTVIFFS